MALDFASLPPARPVPDTPPSRFVWTVAFFILMLVGILAVLLLWPADEPTHTAWFWTCVAVFPIGIAGFVVSRVFRVYEARRLEAIAWNTASQRYAEQAFAKESIPLRILGAAMRVTEDDADSDIERIVGKRIELEPKASTHEADASTSARWFQPLEARLAADDAERHTLILEWLYDKLLLDLKASLAALLIEARLHVLLDISGYVGEADPVELWQVQWRNHQLRETHAERVCASRDLFVVDGWLDGEKGAPRLDCSVVLLVSVSLCAVLDADPLDGTAEAGVGLLVTLPALADRHQLRAIASLHRPLRSGTADLNHALTYALKWGHTEFHALGDAWLTGFDGQTIGALRVALSQVERGEPRKTPIGELDLDRTIGRAGGSSGWLAAVCAALRAAQTATPQLVAQRCDESTVVAVVASGDCELDGTRTSV